ncbi:MAG: class I SAM-dependent methyltransferase [Candidatus Woesearchaeota archaeon]
MSNWNKIYEEGPIHKEPSKEIVKLVPRLKSEGVITVLDAGCGTGRHSIYLAKQGFMVYAVDVSNKAIAYAKQKSKDYSINYNVEKISEFSVPKNSMDFILANHSLEYATDKEVKTSIKRLDSILKTNRPIFLRVPSTKHPFYGAFKSDIYGFSHIGFCIKNELPVHFFDEKELISLFENYKIEHLEHITHENTHEKISVPLKEWVLLAYKK